AVRHGDRGLSAETQPAAPVAAAFAIRLFRHSAFGIRHSSMTTSLEKPRTAAAASLALLAAVSGIAWSAILVRWAGVPGPASAFYRVLVAGIVLIPWWLLRGRRRPLARAAAAVAVLGGVFFALDIAL